MVQEDLLDLVMSGAWRSSSERRVVNYESKRSVRMTVGFVIRGQWLAVSSSGWV